HDGLYAAAIALHWPRREHAEGERVWRGGRLLHAAWSEARDWPIFLARGGGYSGDGTGRRHLRCVLGTAVRTRSSSAWQRASARATEAHDHRRRAARFPRYRAERDGCVDPAGDTARRRRTNGEDAMVAESKRQWLSGPHAHRSECARR